MKTVVEVNSLDELKEKLGNPSRIEFTHCGMDARINWDTYYVSADGRIVGMSDGNKFEKTKKGQQ